MARTPTGCRSAVLALLAGVLLAGAVCAAPVAGAAASRGEVTAAVQGSIVPAPSAKATVVVDAADGVVLQADDAHQPLRVASLAKILTALVVRAHVKLGAPVPISARAAGMPALKINAKAGQVWNATDLLWCLLLPSANDAAVALAEKAGGGTLQGFDAAMAREAAALHLADHPVLHDPAGLDGAYSFDGGNFISARDLAIAARAFLADPVLASIVRQHEHRFRGGDGLAHRIVGHNTFLTTYPGAIGLKTGYTETSGHSLVAAAVRGGRTLIAVVIDSPNPDAVAAAALDAAFGAPEPTGPGVDRLPALPARPHLPVITLPVLHAAVRATPAPHRGGGVPWPALLAVGAAVLAVGMLARRTLVVQRRAVRRLEAAGRRRHPSWPSGRW